MMEMKAIKHSVTSIVRAISLFVLFTNLAACTVVERITEADAAGTPIPPANLYRSSEVPSAWIPKVPGTDTDPNPHESLSKTSPDQTAISNRTIIHSEVGMVRYQDSWVGKEFTVDLGNYDANADFGYNGSSGNGSITLTADTLNYPYGGGASPVLTSFKVETPDHSVIEYVNLKNECASQGMWVCGSASCVENPNCTVQAPSSFFSRSDWDQHQIHNYGYASVNTFPRCDSSLNWASCPSNQNILPSGHYYAKYVLLSDRSLSVSGTNVDLRVRVTVKRDPVSRNQPKSNGAIHLNVILVGNTMIQDSRLQKGALNLNLLLAEANRILKNGANISIGKIKAYEWRDDDGGDYYSQVDFSRLGEMFSAGSQGVDANDEGKSINLFLVRDINAGKSNFSILGLSGAILGPPVNGTLSSGLAIGTNISTVKGVLSEFNVNCTSLTCSRDLMDGSFLEMGATIAHELGHYLGLNHPSEKVKSIQEMDRQTHDQLEDTPTCVPRETDSGTQPYLDQQSCYEDTTLQLVSGDSDCRSACDQEIGGGASYFYHYGMGYSKDSSHYCPATAECQFNHLMWYTVKNRSRTGGVWKEDGSMISPQSSAVIQWNSFLR